MLCYHYQSFMLKSQAIAEHVCLPYLSFSLSRIGLGCIRYDSEGFTFGSFWVLHLNCKNDMHSDWPL